MFLNNMYAHGEQPFISIVIGSIRPAQIKRCIESIKQCTANLEYEIVLVAPFALKPEPRVVQIMDKKFGYYHAIADGFDMAAGQYIIHIPDDSRATPNWASNMIAFMKPHDCELFEGSFRHFDVRGERPEQGHYGKLIAPFICMRNDSLKKIGGLMHTSYSRFFGDPDLSLRVWKAGGKVETCPDAWIFHCDDDDSQYKNAYGTFFNQDKATFINRWYPVFGRKEDQPLGHEQPLKNSKLDRVLPPELSTKIYISLKAGNWGEVNKLLTSTQESVYPEALAELHELVSAMLLTSYRRKVTLYSILQWLSQKGYEPAALTLAREQTLSTATKTTRYATGTLYFYIDSKVGRAVLRIVPLTFRKWLQNRSTLVQAIVKTRLNEFGG